MMNHSWVQPTKEFIICWHSLVTRWNLQRQLPPVLEQLASLLLAGVPLKQALLHMQDAPLQRRLQHYVQALLDAIENGGKLAAVWRKHLPPLYVVLIEAGEMTGELHTVFLAWAQFATERQKWTRKVFRMCTYPCLLLVLSICLLVFLVHTVLPTFLSMYFQLGLHLPASTQFLVNALHELPTVFGFSLVCCLVIGCLLIGLHNKFPHQVKSIVSRIPGYRVIHLQRTREICLVLSLLVDAGIPIVDSLEVLAMSPGPRWLRSASRYVRSEVMRGEPLHKAFVGDWDPLLFVLLRWAEQTGDLVAALRQVEAHVRDVITTRLHAAMQAAEPMMVIGVGAFVGATMLAVFVPMYDLVTQVSSAPIS
jgi:type II secretory pathway component PulF